MWINARAHCAMVVSQAKHVVRSQSLDRNYSLPGMLVRACPSTSTDTASVTDTVEPSVEPRRDDSEDGSESGDPGKVKSMTLTFFCPSICMCCWIYFVITENNRY